MTTIQALSLAIFAGILLVSVLFRINIGAVALSGALLLASVAGISTENVLAAFPGDLVILIIGITLLFAHAQRSGAINWLTESVLQLVGSRRWLIPWVGFVLAAILGTVGGLPAAVVAIVIPIVAGLARTYRINYSMMAVMANWAAIAAGMSPLSPAGALLRTLTQRAHLPYSPWALYGIVMAVHTVAAVIVFFAFGGTRLRREVHVAEWQAAAPGTGAGARLSAAAPAVMHAAAPGTGTGSDPVGPAPIRHEGAAAVAVARRSPSGDTRPAYRIASLAALVILVVTAIGFNVDIGLTALSLALLLQIIFRPPEKEVLGRVAWPVVLLLAGLLIYLNLLAKVGTLHSIQNAMHGISSPVVAMLVLAYVTALFSNMDSSTIVVLGVMAPIGLAISGGSPAAVLAVLVTVATATAIISMSPVHINGSLIIANTPDNDEHQLFRRLIYLTAVISLAVPALMAVYPITVGT